MKFRPQLQRLVLRATLVVVPCLQPMPLAPIKLMPCILLLLYIIIILPLHMLRIMRIYPLLIRTFNLILQSPSTSVAEVLFRTAPENQNRQNRTIKFGSVLFSPRNSWSCSVLGSYIWEDIQNRFEPNFKWYNFMFSNRGGGLFIRMSFVFFIFIWDRKSVV